MEVKPKAVKVFCTISGKQPFVQWLSSLRDQSAAARIKARLARVRLGNLGTTRSLGDGVKELKIDHGPGYRVYFGEAGNEIIVLLSGGDCLGSA
jgi:putative addiction module killer protein